MTDMILTYVPESEHLTYNEALVLAEERDRQAAVEFEQSMPDSEILLAPVLVTRMPESEKLSVGSRPFRGKWITK